MTIRFAGGRHTSMVDAVRAASIHIRRCLDDLDAAVATSRAEWTGEARAAYDRAHREWSDALHRMNDDLDETTEGADAAGSAFAAAEAVAARLWA